MRITPAGVRPTADTTIPEANRPLEMYSTGSTAASVLAGVARGAVLAGVAGAGLWPTTSTRTAPDRSAFTVVVGAEPTRRLTGEPPRKPSA
ncbi:hypothetical protein DMB66_30225 [Actinoplanes sp. ATCC 53533]|nr:hypothetical protein DMB66_30225 [Actinoplanes sp. ATCC 53533]